MLLHRDMSLAQQWLTYWSAICYLGSRFMFSHGFSTLCVGQLEATFEGWLTDVRICTSKYKGDKIVWHESTSDDYIHRPNNEQFTGVCAYNMAMLFKKVQKTAREVNAGGKESTTSQPPRNH